MVVFTNHLNVDLKHHSSKSIPLVIILIFFSLEIVRKFQHCVLWENYSNVLIYKIKRRKVYSLKSRVKNQDSKKKATC